MILSCGFWFCFRSVLRLVSFFVYMGFVCGLFVSSFLSQLILFFLSFYLSFGLSFYSCAFLVVFICLSFCICLSLFPVIYLCVFCIDLSFFLSSSDSRSLSAFFPSSYVLSLTSFPFFPFVLSPSLAHAVFLLSYIAFPSLVIRMLAVILLLQICVGIIYV